MSQATFDYVVHGLGQQNFEQSKDHKGVCVFFGKNDRCCSVGHLLDLSYPFIRTLNSAMGPEEIPFEAWLTGMAPKNYQNLQGIQALQEAHDMGTTKAKMIDQLFKVAEEFGLSVHSKLDGPFDPYYYDYS